MNYTLNMAALLTLIIASFIGLFLRGSCEQGHIPHEEIAQSAEVLIDLTITEDDAKIQFDAFDEEIQLSLRKVSSEDFMPEYLPVSIIDTDTMHTFHISFKKYGIEFYHEVDGLGVFSIHCLSSDINACVVQGTTILETDEILIEPKMNEISKVSFTTHKVLRRPMSISRVSQSNQSSRGQLSKLHKKFLFGLQDNVEPIPGSVDAKVEVLVWTDLSYIDSFHQLVHHPHVETDVLKYVATVVQAGNHIYQNGIKDPSLNISLFLTGVVICKSMECSRFTSDLVHNGTVENHRALDLFAETLAATYSNHSLSFHYDYAVAFTRYDLVDANGTPIGVSFTDDICSIKDGKSSSIIEDQGGYTCIGTFVHELAHTLGSDHDGWFRGKNCDANNGYIMASVSPLTVNGFYFSQCTINSIKTNLLKANASCVLDKPHINHHYEALTHDLPGQIYNTSEQCRQIYGTSFCLSIGTTLEDICHKMYCWDPFLSNVCSTKSSAAPGTSCGHKKWCLNGECVHDDRAP
uniref:A disintegrin and metalloproteinase with thrombospondin motifs 18-like n=1 Tax=Crassostrea virginica TaxID=6565 RepID=A0A8B8A761_CRAVI|nr:A disintegrin and metalloproteinase with thrombospondin motifs 18-like [Crassostrea virginica]